MFVTIWGRQKMETTGGYVWEFFRRNHRPKGRVAGLAYSGPVIKGHLSY